LGPQAKEAFNQPLFCLK